MNQISSMQNTMSNMNSINNMDMNSYIRSMPNSARNVEEQGYDTNTMDMMNISMNQSYMMHGGGLGGVGVGGGGVGNGNRSGNGGLEGINLNLNNNNNNNNGYPNEYISEQDKYTADFISQMKMEQALNSYNNTASIPNATLHELNDSANMHGMNMSIDPSTYESYRNMMNYNNTQNTMKSNQMPMHIEDINNNTNNTINNNTNNSINNNNNNNHNNINNNNMEAMYYNEQTGEIYSEDFIKSLPTTTDAPHITGYGGNFKIPNDNYNQMMQDNYKSMQYPMSVFENMNNPQMFLQHQTSLKPKQTRNVSLLNSQQIPAHMMPHMAPSMQPQIAPCTSLRKIAAGNKRKMKPKKFFPCC